MRWLILVPTRLEREKLDLPAAENVAVEICGFGLVAAAVNATRLIALHQPTRVLLCGIAGTLSEDAEVGSAYQFKRAAMSGIGVGHGADHVSAQQLGWKQFEDKKLEIASELHLSYSSDIDESLTLDLIVSCCSASAGSSDADIVRKKFPQGVVEEMEGFAVAAAAKISSVPCHIVRGVSNVAGNREHANWDIDGAMQSVSKLVIELTGVTND